MAEIKIDGRMKVKTLQTQSKNAFGATPKVYKGKQFADGVNPCLNSWRWYKR